MSLNEDDKSSLVNIISKFRGIEMSDDQIKGYVSDAYSTLKDMGVTKSDVKNIFEKAIEFIKGCFHGGDGVWMELLMKI